MRFRISLGWMIAVTVIIFALIAINARMEATKAWGRPAPTCYEDMACWDCHTMGNKVCGNE